MNTISKLSEAQLHEYDRELKKWIDLMSQVDYSRCTIEVLTDAQVCAMFGVTERTMRSYRKGCYIHFIKMQGRILYLKHVLLQDLLRLNLHELKYKK